MGDMAEALCEGVFCMECSELLDGDAPGHPRLCGSCEQENRGGQCTDSLLRGHKSHKCNRCGKRFRTFESMRQHKKDAGHDS